jgi:hypothetical protein
MRKTIGSLAIAVLLAGVLAGGAGLSAHEKYRFVGTIVKMDAAEKLLTIKTKVNNADFNAEILLDDKTTIERDGKKQTLADLQPGLTVVVDALGDDYFSLEGVTIRIVPAVAKQGPGAPY